MTGRNSVLTMCIALAAVVTSRAGSGAYAIVKTADEFAIGGVGVTGIISREEIALREIRGAPNAQEQLRKILSEGTAAGRMYALFGLRQLDAPDYEALAQPYRSSKVPVRRVLGCIITTDPTADVVQWIDWYAKQLKSWEKKT